MGTRRKIIMIVSFMLTLSGCFGNNEEELVGLWQGHRDGATINLELFSDKTLAMSAPSRTQETVGGNWELLEDNKVKIHFQGGSEKSSLEIGLFENGVLIFNATKDDFSLLGKSEYNKVTE